MIFCKLLHVCGFLQEIHLFLRHGPHLIQNHIQIHQVLEISYRWKKFNRLVKQSDISRHQVIDSLSLHLDNDVFSVQQLCTMHLCNRGRTQCLFVNETEHLLPADAIRLFDHPQNSLKRHGRDLGIELHQFVTIRFRQNIRMQGHNLSQFDIGRPEIL